MPILREIFGEKIKLPSGQGHADMILDPRHQESINTPRRFEVGDKEVPHGLIDVPDIVQQDNWSCGAAASMAVGLHFEMGPKTLPEWKKALGTTETESTRPQAIIDFFKSLGAEVEPKKHMTLRDLSEYWKRGMPVICMVQEYGHRREGKAKFAYGHYLVVIGRDHGFVFVQDPSEDNVTHGNDSANAPGRAMIREADFMRIWHDRDADGRRYINFGIAIGAPKQTHLATANPESPPATSEQQAMLIAYLDALIDAESGDADSAKAANKLHEMLTGQPGPHEEPPEQPEPSPETQQLQQQLSTLTQQIAELKAVPMVKEERTQYVWDDQDRVIEKIQSHRIVPGE